MPSKSIAVCWIKLTGRLTEVAINYFLRSTSTCREQRIRPFAGRVWSIKSSNTLHFGSFARTCKKQTSLSPIACLCRSLYFTQLRVIVRWRIVDGDDGLVYQSPLQHFLPLSFSAYYYRRSRDNDLLSENHGPSISTLLRRVNTRRIHKSEPWLLLDQ